MIMKYFFTFLFLTTFTKLFAQPCSDLFISEYVEGTGNNKAIELYNPTPNPIGLGNYRLIRWDNGSTPPFMGDISTVDPSKVQLLPSNRVIPAYGTFVIALNLTDPNGSGQTAPIDPALQAKADTLLSDGCSPSPGIIRTMCFNGDDAMELQKLSSTGDSWVSVDIFASIGERPTNNMGSFSPTAGWTAIPPFSSMPTNYNSSVSGPYFTQYWTANQTLVRKFNVKEGVKINPPAESFNPSVQWDSLGTDIFDSLGVHQCECAFLNIDEINEKVFVLYPNPSFGGSSLLKTGIPYSSVEVFDIRGGRVKCYEGYTPELSLVNQSLSAGIYLVRINWADGTLSHIRHIIQ
jgi:hypothetical protein